MPQTRRAFVTAAGVSIAGLAGCAGDRASEPHLDSDPAPDTNGADLLLNWQLSGLHVPYVAARERGYYEDEGLELGSIERGQGSDVSATQVGLGNVPFGVTSGDQVLNVAAEGLSPVCVAVIMQHGPVVVFADRDRFGAELAEPEQLAGATVGSGPGMVRAVTQAYVEHHGLADDVEIVDTGADTVQQLLTGEIDVAAGVFGDVVDARHQGATIDELPVADDVPSYGHVIATSEAFLESDPDAVRAFLRATARGAAWAVTEIEAAIDLLVAAEPELAEVRENQRDKWAELGREYMLSETVAEYGWGWSDGDVWRATETVLRDHDVLESPVDAAAVWTNDYLDVDYEYIGEFAALA